MFPTGIDSSKGTTALELLIAFSVFAIVAAFTSPMVSGGAARKEVNQAVELMESCVRHARQSARIYNTEVEMRLQMNQWGNPHSIILSIPEMQKTAQLVEVKEEFTLPVGIRMVSTEEIIHFDFGGEVVLPTTITLVSNQAKDINQLILVK